MGDPVTRITSITAFRMAREARLGRPGLEALKITLHCEACGLKHVHDYPPEALGPFPCPWCSQTRAERE